MYFEDLYDKINNFYFQRSVEFLLKSTILAGWLDGSVENRTGTAQLKLELGLSLAKFLNNELFHHTEDVKEL